MPIAATLQPVIKELAPGMSVRRLLPSAARQMVGPFLFCDHFGPLNVAPTSNFDVRPHPHIGLATITYLLEGAILHRDSLGTVQQIEPGAVNWMTAGRGIVHSERAPDSRRGTTYVNHGLQLWIGLPREFEEIEPSFTHVPAAAIPEVPFAGGTVRVLAGAAFGVQSPIATLSRTLYLDVTAGPGATLELAATSDDAAVYSIDHPLDVDGVQLAACTMAVLSPGQPARIAAGPAGARYLVIGGAPLDGPRFITWNFVSSRRERIDRARDAWVAQPTGHIAGETDWIPFPGTPLAGNRLDH